MKHVTNRRAVITKTSKHFIMAQPEEKQPKGDGSDFIKLQRDLDNAKNERTKEASLDNNRRDRAKTKTDVSQKNTGGDTQVSPGT
jgi:hypothetical protein